MTILYPKSSRDGYDYKRLYQVLIGRGVPSLSDWEHLISFRPRISVQEVLQDRGIRIHRLESASGADVSLDYYPVEVSKFPDWGGGPISPETLFDTIRLDINSFVNAFYAEFRPLEDVDANKWQSFSPADHIGAVLYIGILGDPPVIPTDAAAVVVGHSAPDNWIFTTVWTDESHAHPVTGNRQFGYEQVPETTKYRFYTRGVDALTGALDIGLFIYPVQDLLWKSLQDKIADYVNANNGEAKVVNRTLHRPPLREVLQDYHHPSVGWIPESP